MIKNSYIKNIIEQDLLSVVLLPIISFRRKRVIGLEASFFFYDNGEEISFDRLKNIAKSEKKLLNLERYSRRKAVETYSQFVKNNTEFNQTVLFLSIDSAILKSGVVGSGNIIALVNEFKLNPNRIALGIKESLNADINCVKIFSQKHRERGFIVVIDEVGSGCSNLERMTIVEPDIIKINIAILDPIEKEYYKKGVLKAMCGFAKTLGALVCCAGTDTVNDAMISLDIGAELLQGKLIYDRNIETTLTKGLMDEKIEIISKNFKIHLDSKFNSSTRLYSELNYIAGKMAHELTYIENSLFEKKLREFVKYNDKIECIYVLDYKGIKTTETIFAKGKRSKSRKSIFKPAHIGSDHSSKDYYYNLLRSQDAIFISEPYISGASGSLCITVSTTFMNEHGNKHLLCIDFESDKTNIDW